MFQTDGLTRKGGTYRRVDANNKVVTYKNVRYGECEDKKRTEAMREAIASYSYDSNPLPLEVNLEECTDPLSKVARLIVTVTKPDPRSLSDVKKHIWLTTNGTGSILTYIVESKQKFEFFDRVDQLVVKVHVNSCGSGKLCSYHKFVWKRQ